MQVARPGTTLGGWHERTRVGGPGWSWRARRWRWFRRGVGAWAWSQLSPGVTVARDAEAERAQRQGVPSPDLVALGALVDAVLVRGVLAALSPANG